MMTIRIDPDHMITYYAPIKHPKPDDDFFTIAIGDNTISAQNAEAAFVMAEKYFSFPGKFLPRSFIATRPMAYRVLAQQRDIYGTVKISTLNLPENRAYSMRLYVTFHDDGHGLKAFIKVVFSGHEDQAILYECEGVQGVHIERMLMIVLGVIMPEEGRVEFGFEAVKSSPVPCLVRIVI